MERRTIYISGPITNNADFPNNFINAKNKIIDSVKEGELEFTGIISPADFDKILPADFLYEDYMRIDRCLLSLCQAIYMLKNYEQSSGACQELRMAKELGLEVIFEKE